MKTLEEYKQDILKMKKYGVQYHWFEKEVEEIFKNLRVIAPPIKPKEYGEELIKF